MPHFFLSFFFFNDPATTEIYTLSLHDALPICRRSGAPGGSAATARAGGGRPRGRCGAWRDRKSTRLNSSHVEISYAVFCLKKKKIEEDDSAADVGPCSMGGVARLSVRCYVRYA